jgi:hypothetical protein
MERKEKGVYPVPQGGMNMIKQILGMLLAAGLTLSAGHGENKPESKPGDSTQGGKPMALVISSSAFVEGGMIPTKYTCDGQDFSTFGHQRHPRKDQKPNADLR